MKSNGVAEDRRALDELMSAHMQLEKENAELRAKNEQLRKMVGKPTPPAVKPKAVPVKTSEAEPLPGQFVEYLPLGAKDGSVPFTALVLENKGGGLLRVKVYRIARPDVVLDDVSRDRWRPLGR